MMPKVSFMVLLMAVVNIDPSTAYTFSTSKAMNKRMSNQRFFSTTTHQQRQSINLHQLYSSSSSSNNNDLPLDAEILSSSTTSPPSPTNNNNDSPSMSLFRKIDEIGLSLKPKALTAKTKATSLPKEEEGTKTKRFLYTLQSCLYFTLFIIYRAYRGFFVILPAVFKEVNRKMRDAIDAPFDDDDTEEDGSIVEPNKPKKRTRITVSVLSVLVTASYVVSGAYRALLKFVKTIVSESSVTSSFEAAAEEMVLNEDRVMKISQKKKKEEKSADGNVNGEEGKKMDDGDTPVYYGP